MHFISKYEHCKPPIITNHDENHGNNLFNMHNFISRMIKCFCINNCSFLDIVVKPHSIFVKVIFNLC